MCLHPDKQLSESIFALLREQLKTASLKIGNKFDQKMVFLLHFVDPTCKPDYFTKFLALQSSRKTEDEHLLKMILQSETSSASHKQEIKAISSTYPQVQELACTLIKQTLITEAACERIYVPLIISLMRSYLSESMVEELVSQLLDNYRALVKRIAESPASISQDLETLEQYYHVTNALVKQHQNSAKLNELLSGFYAQFFLPLKKCHERKIRLKIQKLYHIVQNIIHKKSFYELIVKSANHVILEFLREITAKGEHQKLDVVIQIVLTLISFLRLQKKKEDISQLLFTLLDEACFKPMLFQPQLWVLL